MNSAEMAVASALARPERPADEIELGREVVALRRRALRSSAAVIDAAPSLPPVVDRTGLHQHAERHQRTSCCSMSSSVIPFLRTTFL